MNTTHDIPAPPDATEVGEWRLNDGKARHWRGTKRGTTGVHVDIVGDQHVDGTIDRYIVITGDVSVGAAAARGIADDLIAAADEVERMNGYDLNNSGGRW